MVVQTTNLLQKKIFLIGFMGSGKTHWGKIWSEKTGLKFYDLDKVIEDDFKLSITEIFEKKGEEKFRESERFHLHEFGNKGNFILACGGGTPCFYDNISWMKSEGKVLYLKAKPEFIVNHVTEETDKRPVIKEITSAQLPYFIKNKLEEREPFYAQANIIMDVETLNDESLSIILDESSF
jgi:shikimate kinase